MEYLSVIINFMLGGGLIAVLTLRSARKRAAEEAETIELSNADAIVKMQTTYIVEPLKKEINALRREVKRLQRAIEAIRDCPHAAHCPVHDSLQSAEADAD